MVNLEEAESFILITGAMHINSNSIAAERWEDELTAFDTQPLLCLAR